MPTYYIDPVNGNDANDGGGWWKLALASGIGPQPVAGETVTGAGGATGKVIKITGTWATSPTVYLYNRNATAFANGEAITFSGGGSCVNAQGTPYNAVVCSFKTLHKTFAAGDIINVAKSAENAQAGTVTATNGSVSVATTNNLTGTLAQYSLIRIGGDTMLYMVKAITSSVITLYRPYRGVTGAGKGLTLMALPTFSSSDLVPTGGTGTLASPITLNCGVNPDTNLQDGFTVYNGQSNGSSTGLNTLGVWNPSNLVFYGVYRNFLTNFTDCIFTNVFVFRTYSYFSYNGVFRRVTFNNLITELGIFGSTSQFHDVVFNNIETAETGTQGIYTEGTWRNVIMNGWKNAQQTNANPAMLNWGQKMINVRIYDSVMDELAVGNPLFVSRDNTGTFDFDVVFVNPKTGAGALFSMYDTGRYLLGRVAFNMVNGVYNDNRVYSGDAAVANTYTLLSSDNSIFNTVAPAAKITMYQEPCQKIYRHYIPCEAGVAKTISAYLRKNSSYGSGTRPTMRLRWVTGTAGALISNVHDEVMADTNDAFVQVSYAVTPAVKGVIIVEFIFQSLNSGAIAWYSDLGVV